MLKLEVIGFLGKDAESKQVNGKTVTNFSVAHTERWKDGSGEQKEKTTWVECAYWSEKTGILPYLKKGKQVYVEGAPEVRTWESNGKTGASISVRIRDIQLLGSGSEVKAGTTQQQQAPVHNIGAPTATDSDGTESLDSLPF